MLRRGQTILLLASMVALVVLAGASPAAAAGGWSSPTPISGTDTLAPGVVPSVAMDAAGDAYAVWTTAYDSSGGCPCTVRAAGEAAGAGSFAAPVTLWTVPTGSPPENARVAMDAAGDVVVVWDDNIGRGALGTPTGPQVFASLKPAGTAFGNPVEVSSPDTGGAAPAIGMGSRGDMVLAYTTEAASGATHVMTAFAPPGGPFPAPTDITDANDSVSGCCTTSLSVSPDGHAALAFNANTGCMNSSTGCTQEVKAATAPPGGPFGRPTTVSPTYNPGEPYLGGKSSFSSVAADDSGDAAVGYVGSTPPVGSLFLTQNTAEVTFSDEDAPFIFTGSIGSPPMLSGPAVAFDASREGVALAAARSLTGVPTGLLAATRLPGQGFGPTQTLSGNAISGQLAVSNDYGSDDETLAAWVSPGTSSGDSAIGAAFRPGGGAFTTSSVVTASTGQQPTAQQLSAALDPAGNGVIVWPTGDGHIDASFSTPYPPAPPPTPSPSPQPTTVTKVVTVTKAAANVVPRIRDFKAHGSGITFRLGCLGGACRGTWWAVTMVKGKVTVRRRGHRVTVMRPLRVTVAQRSFTLPAGVTRRYAVSLNHIGKQLLAQHHKLGIVLEIKLGRSQWATRKVTVRAARHKGSSHT